MTRASPWIRGGFILVGLVLAVIYVAYLNAVPDQKDDQSTYRMLAESLLAGKGYPTKHWLPGFPVMLAAALWLFGPNWLLLKLSMVGLGFLTAFLAYVLYRQWLKESAAALLALLLSATPMYFYFAHRLMSEIPFLAVSLLALLALVKVSAPADSRRSRFFWAGLLTVSCAAAILIRGNALALAPVLIVEAFRARQAKNKFGVLACGTAFICLFATFLTWSLWKSQHSFEGIDNFSYIEEFQADDFHQFWQAGGYREGVEKVDAAGFGRRVYRNAVWHQTYHAASVFVPFSGKLADIRAPFVGWCLAMLLLIPVFLGINVLRQRSAGLFYYLIFSGVLILTYPTGGSARMLLPSLPLLLMSGYWGLEKMFGTRTALGWGWGILVVNVGLCAAQAEMLSRQPEIIPPLVVSIRT